MRNGEIELDKYIITKSLTKQPEDYPDGKNQHYIQVRPCASSSVSESWFPVLSTGFLIMSMLRSMPYKFDF
jgi:hypothetical protein